MSEFGLAPETVTPGHLFMLLQAMKNQLSVMSAEQVRQGERMQRLETDTEAMRKAWQAGGTLLKFMKMLAGIAVACSAIYAFAKGMIPGGVK